MAQPQPFERLSPEGATSIPLQQRDGQLMLITPTLRYEGPLDVYKVLRA